MSVAEKIELDIPASAGGEPAKRTPYPPAPIRYGAEELAELQEVLEQNTLFYAQGRKVYQLEEEIAARHGVRFAVATSSGTSAVHAALIGLGISPGDEVIVSPITDMGTLVPILYQGAVPIFVDLTPQGYVLDPAAVEAAITERTRAVIAVHLWGNPCDLSALRALCDSRGILLVEDCAQAWGATYNGKPVGTFGQIGCFSYNEFKHISCGDGGLVITDDEALARRLRLATDKAYNRRPDALIRQPIMLANNYRMTELQAAVAVAQLKKLDSIVSRRRAWCESLTDRLQGTPGISLPTPTEGSDPSWWFYMMRIDPTVLGNAGEPEAAVADRFLAALAAEGVRATAHYIGQPIYRYPIFVGHSAYERKDYGTHPYERVDYTRVQCPVAESILATSVTIPINESLTLTDRDEIAHAVRRVAAWMATEA